MTGQVMPVSRKVPSLVDLCVDVAVRHARYLGDVGETDFHLLDRILPSCTLDQLIHVEERTERDLTPVTDELWKGFYKKEFGEKNLSIALQRMTQHKVSFKWKDLYEAKLTANAEKEKEAAARLRQLYKKEDAKKQSRQIRICTKVPPASKRSFFGGGGPGYNLSNVKSNIMKKAKLDFLKSPEVRNIAAMRNMQRQNSVSSMTKPPSFPRNNHASSSRQTSLPRGKF
ncbi:uncharacterized protein [Euphorbia lathyris]|uniref:uncharacterized protein n=1 Tax=Euphorbia lathyris TaxID=212925 RepID=UPI0033140D40